MDRTAVFVDAGYLFAAGSKLLCGERLPRGELRLGHEQVVRALEKLAIDLTGLPLLRIYWYDGADDGPTSQQLALSYCAKVKLRLGFVNQHGQQKGVESLIVSDLINLARNRAMADALLLTGDKDIRVGVQQAQEFGVRVHLLGIYPSRENQSGFLVQEADALRELARDEVAAFLARDVDIEHRDGMPSGPAKASDLEAVAQRIAAGLSGDESEAALRHYSATGAISKEIDRRLLALGSQASGVAELSSWEKRQLRAAFLSACHKATRL